MMLRFNVLGIVAFWFILATPLYAQSDDIIERARDGDPNAQRSLAQYYEMNDYGSFVFWSTLSSVQEHELTHQYLTSLLVEDGSYDLDFLVAGTKRAAEWGHANWQFLLSLLYRSGVGIERDNAEGLKWLKSSAEQEYMLAVVELGRVLSEGGIVKQNHVEAVRWYRLAAEQGDASRSTILGCLP